MVSSSSKFAGWFVALFILALPASRAVADAGSKPDTDCTTNQCTWSIAVNGDPVLNGAYAANIDGSLYVPT